MKTIKQLQDKLDTIFSKFIRLRDTDDYGYGKCITCGKTFHFRDLECGHFRHRRHLSVRWNDQNAHAQCHECNTKDDAAAYMVAMLDKRGMETAFEIIEMSKIDCKFRKQDYEDMYNTYRELVKKQVKSKMFEIKY